MLTSSAWRIARVSISAVLLLLKTASWKLNYIIKHNYVSIIITTRFTVHGRGAKLENSDGAVGHNHFVH